MALETGRRPMVEKIVGLLTGLIAGYLTGMVIGFLAFDPNTDIYALLGAVLALVGMGLGLTPFFRRYLHGVQGMLFGFYLGALVGILLFGNAPEDNLLELTRNPGALLCSLVGVLVGGGLALRQPREKMLLPLVAALVGGFFGGLALGLLLGLPRNTSMVGWSPLVIGCGVLAGGFTAWWQRRSAQKNPS